MERGAQSAISWNELKECCRQRAPVLELQRQALRTDAGAEDVPQLARGLRYIMLWVWPTEQHKLEWVQSHNFKTQVVRAGESVMEEG